jgi:hypothetical protein
MYHKGRYDTIVGRAGDSECVIWEIILRDFWCDILRVSHANPITNVSRTL